MKKIKNLFLVAVFATLTFAAFSQGDTSVSDTVVSVATDAPVTTVSMPSITAEVSGLSLSTLGWIGVGFIGYFIARFRIAFATTAVKFDAGEWLKRNWTNCLYLGIALFAIHYFKIQFTATEAIFLGSSPNLLIDWIQRESKALGLKTP